MKPGRSAETMTCLPSSPARSRTAASVASSVAVPRISSISGMTGTGLKKCMPTNRARRPSATDDASRSMEIDEVLVAKTAAGGAMPSSPAHSARLDVEVLEHRLDHEVRVGGRGEVVRRDEARQRRVAVRRRRAGPSRRPGRGCPRSGRGRPRRAPASGSYRATCLPIAAWTWAMPWPISPAPATNTRSIVIAPERTPPGSPPRARRRPRDTAAPRRARHDRRTRGTRRRTRRRGERRRARPARAPNERRGTRSSSRRRRPAPSRRRATTAATGAPGTRTRSPTANTAVPTTSPSGLGSSADEQEADRRDRAAPRRTVGPAPTWSGSLAKRDSRSTTTITA